MRRRLDEREAAGGDPEAQRAALEGLLRARDPSLMAAAELRAKLRAACFRAVDLLPRSQHVRFQPAIAVLAAALEDGSRARGCGWQEIAHGSWIHGERVGLGAFALRANERVLIGVGTAISRALNPGSLWPELHPWSGKPATRAAKVEAWLRSAGRTTIVETPLAVARDLCRYERWAGPRAFPLWSQAHPEPARDRGAREQRDWVEPGAPLLARLGERCAALGLERLDALLLEHVGHPDRARLLRSEVEHLVHVLSGWLGRDLVSENDARRIRQLHARVSAWPLARVLASEASAEAVETVPRGLFARVLERLRALEGFQSPYS